MAVYLTNELRQALVDAGQNPDDLADLFEAWKARPEDEFNSPFFGKDGAYDYPKVYGERPLRHVHLPPLASKSAKERWRLDFLRRRMKRSNRALVYASRRNGDHLLIAVFDDPPGAHSTARNEPALMKRLAGIADAFIQDGVVVV